MWLARRRSVIDLARRSDWHRTHAEHVSRLCLQLFDELATLHGMGALERELIEYGALLHDIGFHIGRSGHHKHSMYLIVHGDLKSFSKEEVLIIANIARYHRKADPGKKHDNYAALSPRGRRIVNIGAALLRIADGLDRSHCNVIQKITCRIKDRKVVCRLSARSDAALEIWGADRKRQLFQQVFGKEIEFELV